MVTTNQAGIPAGCTCTAVQLGEPGEARKLRERLGDGPGGARPPFVAQNARRIGVLSLDAAPASTARLPVVDVDELGVVVTANTVSP